MYRTLSRRLSTLRPPQPALRLTLLAGLLALLSLGRAQTVLGITPNPIATPYIAEFVDQNNPNAADGGNCQDPTHPCKTIGFALGVPVQAPYGQGIEVAPGLYCEHFSITHDPNNLPIAINGLASGFGAQSGTTLIDGEGPGSQCSGTLTPNTVFAISSGISLELSGLTVQHGQSHSGGGISNAGTLTMTNSTISDNSVTFDSETNVGGKGGGIASSGTLTLTNVTISGNTTAGPGAATGGGGGIYMSGTATLNNVTLSGNSAPGAGSDGGGILLVGGTATLNNVTLSANSTLGQFSDGGGIENFDGTATLTNVNLSGNSTTGIGGGIVTGGTSSNLTLTNVTVSGNSALLGGGIYNNGSQATLTNVTLSGNSGASEGGGIYNAGFKATLINVTLSDNSTPGDGGGIFNESDLALTNLTLSGNTAFSGGGIFNQTTTGVATLQASILAGNSAGNCFNAAGSTLVSNGRNVADDNTCPSGPGDLPSTNPQLGPLADNGGPTLGAPGATSQTLTMALLSGSPAVDRVPASLCPPPSTDQRGVPRPQGAACDSGAFESSLTAPPTSTPAASPTPSASSTPTPTPGGPSVTYAAGWNLVAGPTGTTMTGALGPLYTYQASDSNYETINGSVLTTIEGFWVYFSSATTITLPLASGTTTTSLTLPVNHYVMAGNPFSRPATFSAPGATIDTYSPATGYATATGTVTLGVGQGAWVLSSTGGTLTITST